jgi:predicted house-cleaning noncanonical NTP pyrophosphatase (MazG superfamily)
MQQESFDQLFQRFLEFSQTTFSDAKAESYLTKLEEEIRELKDDPNMEELADCMMVLIGLSRFLPGDLKEILAKKIEINENRTWQKQSNGTYRHID